MRHPTIVVTSNKDDVADQAIAVLVKGRANLYRRDDGVVVMAQLSVVRRGRRVERFGRAYWEPAVAAYVLHSLSKVADFINAKGRPIPPPRWLANEILRRRTGLRAAR
jgi:hypothetical protein